MLTYRVCTDAERPTWWDEFVKDGSDCRERLRVTREDISGGSCLRTVPARKPVRNPDNNARADLEFYAWSRARIGSRALTRLIESGQDIALHGSYFHALHHRDPAERRRVRALFVREGDTVELREMPSRHTTYAAVLHVRRWLLLLSLLVAALLVCLCLTFCGNPAAQDGGLSFLQGMTQTEGAKSEPVLSVEYASYASTPDSTLQADRLAQHLVLSLPANCKDGGNPIDSAPSIYIDLDHDGEFEASELVYNPNGDLLKAGTEVSELEFTQAVPADTYDALTRWDSVLSSDHSQPAGSATFKWVAIFL